jgi:hypothetical protein
MINYDKDPIHELHRTYDKDLKVGTPLKGVLTPFMNYIELMITHELYITNDSL